MIVIPGLVPATTSFVMSRPAPDRDNPAWGFSDHRAVCEIAWMEMTPAARSEARRLTEVLGLYPTFAESCIWADGPEAKQIHNSHWINLEPGVSTVSMSDCPDDCVIRHLATERERLRDRGSAPAVRARALMYIGHFVGDLHAPLHVGYASDRGGNGHRIEGLGGRIDDLHAVWDRYLTRDRDGQWRRFATELHDEINPVDRTLWTDSTPLDWAMESFQIVEADVYNGLSGPAGSGVSDAYVAHNRPTAERQLKKAGVRLGALLNSALAGDGGG